MKPGVWTASFGLCRLYWQNPDNNRLGTLFAFRYSQIQVLFYQTWLFKRPKCRFATFLQAAAAQNIHMGKSMEPQGTTTVEGQGNSLAWLKSPAMARVLPFAVYVLFIAVLELGEFAGILSLTAQEQAVLYPVKAGCTALALVYCLRLCPEISWRHLADYKSTALAIFTGLLVFVLWINLDMPWATLGNPEPFAHDAIPEGLARSGFLITRLLGAAIVVPLAEELFWRSWLIRAVDARDFQSVPIGKPSLVAFFAVNVLFALEHNLVLAGFVAGCLYTLLLYRTKSVTQCVLAHAVTNGVLGIWVMTTGNWAFW